MRRATLIAVLAAGLIVPRSSAFALSTQSYDFCGGSYSGFTGLGFCASVVVSVTQAPTVDQWGITHAAGAYTVSMQVMNNSGPTTDSYAGSLFTQIGLDNLLGPLSLANPADILIVQNDAVVCKNTTDNTKGTAQCYSVKLDATAAGGVRVDFLSGTTNGVNQSISSACSGGNDYLYTCGIDAIASNDLPVTISFDVMKNLDLTNAELYVKSQSQLGSTECETGNIAPSISCSATPPSTTTTPEPGTLALLTTGFGGFGFMGLRRRRKTA